MANTFVLIAQQPLDFKGQHYEPGDTFVADAFEAAPFQRQRLTIEAPQEQQREHGSRRGVLLRTTAPVVEPTKRPRGRPRKTSIETTEAPRYQRRDLQAEE